MIQLETGNRRDSDTVLCSLPMSRSSSRSSIDNELLNFPEIGSNNVPMIRGFINNDLTSSSRSLSSSIHNPSPTPQSLLSAQRPSWTPSLSFRGVQPSDGKSPTAAEGGGQTTSSIPSSPEDRGNFRRSLQIDNKGLVGDAVGNVSAGPIIFNELVAIVGEALDCYPASIIVWYWHHVDHNQWH